MNGLNNSDKTDREYSLAPNVKHKGHTLVQVCSGRFIYVDSGRRSPSSGSHFLGCLAVDLQGQVVGFPGWVQCCEFPLMLSVG